MATTPIDRMNMPQRDAPIFGGTRPQSPTPSLEQATREQATASVRQAASLAPLDQVDQAMPSVIQQATAQMSAGRMQDRQHQFATEITEKQLAEQQRQLTSREELFKRHQELEQEKDRLVGVIQTTDANLSNEIFQSNLRFSKDELGRTFLNQRQLADFAILQARNQEELQQYEQIMLQSIEMRQQTLRVAQARIQQALSEEFAKDEQARDQELTKLLTTAKHELEKKQRAAQAAASNRSSLFRAVGGIVLGGAAVAVGVTTGAAPIAIAGAASVAGSVGMAGGSLAAGVTSGTPGVSDADRSSALSPIRQRYGV